MTNETSLCKIPFSTFKFTCKTVEKRTIDLFKSPLEVLKREDLCSLRLASKTQKGKQSSSERWYSKCVKDWIDERVGTK